MKRPWMGKRFGMLTVIGYDGDRRICRCDCGNVVSIYVSNLLRQKACGCLRRKKEKWTDMPEYSAWEAMIARCENRNNKYYHNYGGRGITVCRKWRHSFEAFLADVGKKASPRHSLERKDNGGNYAPGNVKLATRNEQMRNTRLTHTLTINGVTKPMITWAEERKIPFERLRGRVRLGWPTKKLFDPPNGTQGEEKGEEKW